MPKLSTSAASRTLPETFAPIRAVKPNLQCAAGEWLSDESLASGSMVPSLSRILTWPLMIPVNFTADRIACWTTNSQASSVVRMGVYLNDPAADRPGALLFDAGTVDTSSGSGIRSATINEKIPAGMVWICVAVQGAAGTLALQRFFNTSPKIPSAIESDNLDKSAHLFRASVPDAFPATFGTPTGRGLNSAPVLALRAA